MADPTYENDLLLCSTFIRHDSLAREAVVTYALDLHGEGGGAQGFADRLQGNFTDNWAAQLDTNAVITRTTTLLGNGTSVFTTGESSSAGVRGLTSHDSIPSNSAVLVKKLTGLGGRRNRGRMYMPWMVGHNEVDELGNIDSGELGDIQTIADAWQADVEDGGFQALVIAQRFYDRAWNVAGRRLVSVEGSTNPVSTLVVEPMIATQRRRMPR